MTGQALSMLRKRYNVSRAEFAAFIGFTERTVRRWENASDRRPPFWAFRLLVFYAKNRDSLPDFEFCADESHELPPEHFEVEEYHEDVAEEEVFA